MGKRTKKGPTPEEQQPLPFLEWCAAVRLTHSKCTIAQLPGTGRGVVATQNISAGEVVVEVPDEVVLLVENSCIAQELEDAGLAKGVADDPLLEIQGLVLAVMAEKAAGTRSDWASYLQWIPDDLSHLPLYWTEEELEELQGTAAADKMEGHVQTPSDVPTQVRMLWEEVAEPFIKEHPQLKLPSGSAGWALYQWSTAAVASYSFVLGDDHYQAMVPFWDALNHITGQVNVRLHHEQNAKSHKGCLQMIATRDIAAGEEVVNNYGELSQAELLRAYGYVERHDKAQLYSHVQVPLRFVLQSVALTRLAHPAASAPASSKSTTKPSKSKAAHKHDAACTAEGCDHQHHHHHHHTNGACPDGTCDGGSESGDDSDGASDWDLVIDDELDDLLTGSPYGDVPPDHQLNKQDQPAPKNKKQKQQGKQKGKASSHTAADRMKLGVLGMGRRQCREAVAGLPGRLRYLKRVGLLPSANVFKLFMPDNKSPKSNLFQLLELIRLLLLPLPAFEAHRQSVANWRPDESTAGTLDTLDVLVDAGPLTAELAQQVDQVLQETLRYMLSRYKNTLDEDLQLLSSSERSAPAAPGTKRKGKGGAGQAADGQGEAVHDRRMKAVIARVAEQQCLQAWLDGPRGSQEAWCKQALVECWSKPRPGMFGVAGVGSESGSDSCDDDEEEEEEEAEEAGSCGAGTCGHPHHHAAAQHKASQPKKQAKKTLDNDASFSFGFQV